MRDYESLLAPDSPDSPECKCRAPMRLAETRARGDAAVRVYRCPKCSHEFQLMVWTDLNEPAAASLGL
jgi:hypothetical protein